MGQAQERFGRTCGPQNDARPSRGLLHPVILVMQPVQNGRGDHSTSFQEVMAGWDPWRQPQPDQREGVVQ